MPRKVKSWGVSTPQRDTSVRRALSADSGPRGSRRRSATAIADGGKWSSSGRKTVERGEGPQIASQRQPGRGPKTRTVVRAKRKNHPSHG